MKRDKRGLALSTDSDAAATTFDRAVEHYLQAILELSQEKGYARTGDIARKLGVKSPSVSGMLQKLHLSGMLTYEKYAGAKLTCRGCEIAKSIRLRRNIFAKFLKMMGVPEEAISRAAKMINEAQKPVIIAGRGIALR